MIYLLFIPQTLCGAIGAYFLKRGSEKSTGLLSWFTIPDFYIGGVCYVLGFSLNILLLRYIDYTIVYPMNALTYVWSQLVAFRFMGEPITNTKVIGVIMLIAGMVLLTR